MCQVNPIFHLNSENDFNAHPKSYINIQFVNEELKSLTQFAIASVKKNSLTFISDNLINILIKTYDDTMLPISMLLPFQQNSLNDFLDISYSFQYWYLI